MLSLEGGVSFVGVMGWPLTHTLSPVIHNAAFQRLGLDWVYLAWPVPPKDLRVAVGGLRSLGAMGANVTMPHKESVIRLLDDLSGDAARVGAVNTIQRLGDRLIGHNTDVDGFREFLTGDVGFDATGRSTVVLGAGGAARAVVRALGELRAGDIVIAARRATRGKGLVDLARPGNARIEVWDRATALASSADLIVNCTPIGMTAGDPLPDARFRPGQVVVDLIYQPPTTTLVQRARAAGADAWGGLGMLVHQGASSFQIWTGQSPPLETMSAAAVHAIRSGRPAGDAAHPGEA